MASIDRTRTVATTSDEVWAVVADFGAISSRTDNVDGLPRRLRRVTNRWALRPGRDDTTVVTLTSPIEIGSRPWQRIAEHVACRVLARQSDVLLAGLANRLEKAGV